MWWTMNKPLMRCKVEIWASSCDYLRHGASWYMWMMWWLTNRKFFDQMKKIADSKLHFARGIYDKFHDKIILCAEDISLSSIQAIQKTGAGDYHKTFALTTYFTLVHEMLHKCDVAKDADGAGHKVDFDRFEKLPSMLQDIFDGLLEMEFSNDNFANHPENRRRK